MADPVVFSKRADILKRVLEWISQGRYQVGESWALFGSKVLATVSVDGADHEELWDYNKAELEKGYESLGDLQIQAGKLLDAKRTSLDVGPPKATVRGLEPSEVEPGADWRALQETEPTEISEDLDALYALEMIEKLPKIVDRATALGPHEIDVDQAPERLRMYFKEVHYCFFYGLPFACAVLCRALLEAALEAKYRPSNRPAPWKPSHCLSPEERRQSKILSLLDLARQDATLDGSRVEAAENVKDAGDAAIHRPLDFQKQWAGDEQLRRIVEDTRKVLEDLYW